MTARAILLVNLGSPRSLALADVRSYLDEFLMDPCVIDTPFLMRAALVRGHILRTRPKNTAEAYEKIWTEDGSPLIVISEQVRMALEAVMDLPVGLAMRYATPSIAEGLAALQARVQRLDELIVVPLYPQYAMASTGTVEIALRRALAASDGTSRPWFGTVKVVPPFYNNGAYLNALATIVGRHWTKDIQFILFSYHGLPKRHLIKTDPTHAHCLSSPLCCQTRSLAHVRCYRHQVIETTKGVADRIALPPDMHGISFQSRLGRGWLEPFTDVELELLPKRGVASLAVVCPAFVSDCLETLEEIAMRGREIFLRAGGSAFTYIPCLNDDPVWIEALASICEAAAAVAA